LVKYLDIDEKAFGEWLRGELFQDAFQELLQECIKPEQAKVSTGQRPRGPSFTAVETAMKAGEAYGGSKYSARKVKKDGWKILDHYAYTMWLLISENSSRRKGLFWRRKNREHMKFCKL
jgi:hypothetical protein